VLLPLVALSVIFQYSPYHYSTPGVKVRHSKRGRIEDVHTAILAHPDFAYGRQPWLELRKFPRYGFRDPPLCRRTRRRETGAHLGPGEGGSGYPLFRGVSRNQVNEGLDPLRPARTAALAVFEHDHIRTVECEKLTDFFEALSILLDAADTLHTPVDERHRPFEDGVAEASRRRENRKDKVCA